METAQTPDELAYLEFLWELWARPNQLAPEGKWRIWLILAGRFWGKTRTGSEWIIEKAKVPNTRIALVGRTIGDVIKIMVRGKSGLIARSPEWFKAHYVATAGEVRWPNGSIASLYSSDEPDQLRGPEHHYGWADELASWRYLQETWSNLDFGLRLGDMDRTPQVAITTTPRPLPMIIKLLDQAAKQLTSTAVDQRIVVTRGKSVENKHNVAAGTHERLVAEYQNTRLARQEMDGEILTDAEGAYWRMEQLELLRKTKGEVPAMLRVVVGVDPALSTKRTSDLTGIVVVGLGVDDKLYVLEDMSDRYKPAAWAAAVILACQKYSADCVVIETNAGHDLIESTLMTAKGAEHLPRVLPMNSAEGKCARAEPVSGIYEQGHVHHAGSLAELESEMCTWEPLVATKSPNRIDALVFACAELKPSMRRYNPDAQAKVEATQPVHALASKVERRQQVTQERQARPERRSRWR